jgi:hypothetical protein
MNNPRLSYLKKKNLKNQKVKEMNKKKENQPTKQKVQPIVQQEIKKIWTTGINSIVNIINLDFSY